MTKKNQVNGVRLDERAMLVHLTIGLWEGQNVDKQKTEEVTTDARAAKDAGTWKTYHIPRSATKPIWNARMRARNVHYQYTLPWQDTGARILPADMFMKYTTEMRKAQDEFNKVVATFIKAYPGYVTEAKTRLGTLFRPEMFPPSSEIGTRFPWSLRFSPLPTADDFRVNLGVDATREIREQIQKESDAAMQEAMQDLWYRLHENVKKIADKLSDAEGVFRDSLIENVADLVDLLPAMNVTKDPELEKLRQDVAKRLSKQDPGALRTNKAARADVAKAADDIVKKMEAFMRKGK